MERGGWWPGVRPDPRSRVRNLMKPQARRHEHRQRRQNPDAATGTGPRESIRTAGEQRENHPHLSPAFPGAERNEEKR